MLNPKNRSRAQVVLELLRDARGSDLFLDAAAMAIRAERILKEVGGMTHIREHVQRGRFTLAIDQLRMELGR